MTKNAAEMTTICKQQKKKEKETRDMSCIASSSKIHSTHQQRTNDCSTNDQKLTDATTIGGPLLLAKSRGEISTWVGKRHIQTIAFRNKKELLIMRMVLVVSARTSSAMVVVNMTFVNILDDEDTSESFRKL
jgi:hypothetical protein